MFKRLLKWFAVLLLAVTFVGCGSGPAASRIGSARAAELTAVGIVAVLLVPSVLILVNEAEEWGRDCVLDPGPDC